MSTIATKSAAPDRLLRVSIWIAQTLIFLGFTLGGVMKLFIPIPRLAAMIAWAGQLPEPFVRFIGLIDLLGGVGILLPALTRIRPGLTVLAALGCTLLQICAIIFHVSRGEAAYTPVNFVFLALAVFVLWGRTRKAPVQSRT
jgi:hypothetical protein